MNKILLVLMLLLLTSGVTSAQQNEEKSCEEQLDTLIAHLVALPDSALQSTATSLRASLQCAAYLQDPQQVLANLGQALADLSDEVLQEFTGNDRNKSYDWLEEVVIFSYGSIIMARSNEANRVVVSRPQAQGNDYFFSYDRASHSHGWYIMNRGKLEVFTFDSDEDKKYNERQVAKVLSLVYLEIRTTE